MKKKTKKTLIRVIAVILAMLMPMSTAVAFAAAGDGGAGSGTGGTSAIAEKYASPDINEISGHGEEPEELSVSAGATYQEKAWYEYVAYSEHAVSSYRIDDDHRLLFYDPYTYTNSMIMDVQFDATTTEFDTMSSYTVSSTNSKTILSGVEATYTSTDSTQTSGRDETGSFVENGGYTHTKYNYDDIHSTSGTINEKDIYHYDSRKYDTTSKTTFENLTLGSHTELGWGLKSGGSETIIVDNNNGHENTTNHIEEWYVNEVEHKTEYNDYISTTTHQYEQDIEDHTTSKTEGWEQLSARVTKTVGSSSSTSTSWSETESTTVTKTYAATHFASDGVTPLPWAIVHYSVQMPMKCCLQVKYSGEWVTVSTVYCLLTTIKGTCRAWLQNGQTYYEDWGSGEPVVATDFWSQFMTKDQLMNAYQNKLYPVGGDD